MGKEGAEKKESVGEKASAPVRTKGHTPMPDGCHSWGCKSKAHRFNFCNEHYEHFKFGLIKKTGEPVMDYDKKFEHFAAYKKRQGTQKAA